MARKSARLPEKAVSEKAVSEEAVFDEYVDFVVEIIERLEQLDDLVKITEPVMPYASDNGTGRPAVRSLF